MAAHLLNVIITSTFLHWKQMSLC